MPGLIAIDGRPCSGKSSLAEKLASATGAEILSLDDFFLPKSAWPSNIQPAFPFPYFRYDEFVSAARTLAAGKTLRYVPYDWNTQYLSDKSRTIEPHQPIIVEGVSALHPDLCRLYKLRIFVMSDLATEMAAITTREQPSNLINWHELYLPSAELYFETNPWERAELIVCGRGIISSMTNPGKDI